MSYAENHLWEEGESWGHLERSLDPADSGGYTTRAHKLSDFSSGVHKSLALAHPSDFFTPKRPHSYVFRMVTHCEYTRLAILLSPMSRSADRQTRSQTLFWPGIIFGTLEATTHQSTKVSTYVCLPQRPGSTNYAASANYPILGYRGTHARAWSHGPLPPRAYPLHSITSRKKIIIYHMIGSEHLVYIHTYLHMYSTYIFACCILKHITSKNLK